jgi:hypothetical protein
VKSNSTIAIQRRTTSLACYATTAICGVILGLQPPPSPTEAEAAVASAVSIFLHGIYGPYRLHAPKGGAQEQ